MDMNVLTKKSNKNWIIHILTIQSLAFLKYVLYFLRIPFPCVQQTHTIHLFDLVILTGM
jgi:hypothetical protein